MNFSCDDFFTLLHTSCVFGVVFLLNFRCRKFFHEIHIMLQLFQLNIFDDNKKRQAGGVEEHFSTKTKTHIAHLLHIEKCWVTKYSEVKCRYTSLTSILLTQFWRESIRCPTACIVFFEIDPHAPALFYFVLSTLTLMEYKLIDTQLYHRYIFDDDDPMQLFKTICWLSIKY